MPQDSRVWLITAFGDDRQYGGNLGYAEDSSQYYRYDSDVGNHKQVKVGDIFVVRGTSRIIGVARVVEISEVPDVEKVRQLCPACHQTTIKARERKTPTYRCYQCKTEFEHPEPARVSVTQFVASYDGIFIPVSIPFRLEKFKGAMPRYSNQLSIQELTPALLGAYGRPIVDAVEKVTIAERGTPTVLMPTADAGELERRVRVLRNRGIKKPPTGNGTPRRVPQPGGHAYERDPSVKAWILGLADGVCESCGEKGPFQVGSGEYFLEVHHVALLAEGGPDTTDNAVALCPNCHRAFHLAGDREKRVTALRQKVSRLKTPATGQAVGC